MVVYHGRAGLFISSNVHYSVDTVDHLTKRLIVGVGGLIMLIGWYLEIMLHT